MFLIGGIDGVFLASPPVDFALTETYWVVSHIHYVLFGGSVFAVYAGFYYWFPKFQRQEAQRGGLGKLHFWLQFIGFNLTFFSMHILGLLGMPRRIQDYEPLPDWIGLNQLQTVGALIIALSTAPFLANVHDHAPQGQGPRGSGRQHLGVVHHLPAAGAQLRQPARDPSERPLFDLRHADVPSIPTPPPQEPADGCRRRPLQERPPRSTDKPGGISSSLLGMVRFIASEVMFFGGLFGAYFPVWRTPPHGGRRRGAPTCRPPTPPS